MAHGSELRRSFEFKRSQIARTSIEAGRRLALHGVPMLRRADAQTLLKGWIEIADRDAAHAVLNDPGKLSLRSQAKLGSNPGAASRAGPRLVP